MKGSISSYFFMGRRTSEIAVRPRLDSKLLVRVLELRYNRSHTLAMKTKKKKCRTAAVNVASKKGRPTKTYTTDDAVRMVSICDERRVQSLSW